MKCKNPIQSGEIFHLVFVVLGVVSFFFAYEDAAAQTLDTIEIAEIYPITGENIKNGDIISLDPLSATYIQASLSGDPHIVGVVVNQPLLLFDTKTTGVPVVRTGHARVNVSTLGGPIGTGNAITSSSLLGAGKKATEDDPYILGFALEPFLGTEENLEIITVEGVVVQAGSIMVDLAIGPSRFENALKGETFFEAGGRGTRTAIQYLVAALVALGSIFFAFKNFGSSIQNGILSMGRNPRAKVSIQLSLLYNLFLILIISAFGIFLSLIILKIEIF